MPHKPYAALVSLLILTHCNLAYSGGKQILERLPISDVFPLEDTNSCACSIFRGGAPLSPGNVILSTIAFSDSPHTVTNRIRVDGKTKEFEKVVYSKSKGVIINRYETENIKVVARFKDVNYHKHCTSYAEPPSHGSCAIGTIAITYGSRKENGSMLQVCGC